MTQYIPKAALVAEIDKRFHQLTDAAFDSMIGRNLIEIKDFIDTLEVKEVDLEKEIDDWYNTIGIPVTTNALKETARYFFKLGFKAQKGEEI